MEYIAALAATEAEDTKLLQSPDAHLYGDFDEDLAEDSRDIIEAMEKLQTISMSRTRCRGRDQAGA